MSMQKIMKKLGLVSEELQAEPLTAITATANTVETNTFTIPMDMVLFGIDLRVTRSDTGAAVDGITNIEMILDGNKVIKNYTGGQCKAAAMITGYPVSQGFYKVIIADPELQTDPINLEQFTTGQLRVTTSAIGAGVSVVVAPELQLGNRASYPTVSDLGMGKVLIEKNLPQRQYGAALGDCVYENERVNRVYGYILETGDAGVLADTTFNTVRVEARNAGRTVTPYNGVSLVTQKQLNLQDTGNVALPAGIIYLPFADGFPTSKYASMRTILNATVAGVNKTAMICERYILGGI